jgi:hypothetical protein
MTYGASGVADVVRLRVAPSGRWKSGFGSGSSPGDRNDCTSMVDIKAAAANGGMLNAFMVACQGEEIERHLPNRERPKRTNQHS